MLLIPRSISKTPKASPVLTSQSALWLSLSPSHAECRPPTLPGVISSHTFSQNPTMAAVFGISKEFFDVGLPTRIRHALHKPDTGPPLCRVKVSGYRIDLQNLTP